ncbi:MAG: HD-GYP domain-containing protein [Nitrospirae bacterium]|nr:HD-GYP domain-containing protein [Nitrospirota bacterium]
MNQNNSILQRIPLTIKMLILTIAVGITAGGVLDYFQTKKVRAVFYAELLERLNRQSHEDRIRFDNYAAAHSKAAKLIISQGQFIDYIKKASFAGDSPPTRYINEIPSWLPQASVLRSLIAVRYALLLDAKGRVREVYQNSPDAPPKSLLNPTDLLMKLSHNQSYMTDIDGIPFLITAESLSDHYGKIPATLILASPLDSEFLASSLGQVPHINLIALAGGEKKQVVATNKPELIPIGTPLDSLEGRYLITGKSFFDEGVSDLILQFTSLISVDATESVIQPLISSSRKRRAVLVLILIISFSLVVTYITRHIRELTQYVLNFSQQTFGKDLKTARRGDELITLKNEFHDFAEEIIKSRNDLLKRTGELERSEQSYKETAEVLSAALEDIKKREQTLLKGREAFLNMLEDITGSYKDLEDLFMSLVSAMVHALDAKSPWTRGHSERVANYAVMIAREMGLDEDEIKDLRLAGLLHDVGKIGTYDYLLDKPAKLTDEEFGIVKKHPAQGADILRDIKQLTNIVPLIRHHHERIDGRGYPDGLKGEEIPLGARILHVADSFDSMTADRPYRPSPGSEYAISEFKKYSGTQFDAGVVEAFLKIFGKTEK